MPTPSARRRTKRAASKTQFGEATLGGFLRRVGSPLSVFIILEQPPTLLLIATDDQPSSLICPYASVRIFPVPKSVQALLLPWTTKLTPPAQEFDVGVL
jgi:hypothetical protein